MNLLNDNINKLYKRFLLPSLGSAMVLSIYTMTDAIVIGKGIGADALASLSLTTPLLCILMATGILFGVGGSVHMNMQRGIGNHDKSNRFFTISLASISLITILLWLIYGLFMPELLHLMGATDVLYPYAADYMKYIIIFFPVTTFSNYLAIFVRTDNEPNRAMYGVICGGILNIVLDIIFVFPLNFGMGGASLASCIGMTVQVCISGSHFLSKRNNLRLISPHHITNSLSLIISSGASSFLNEFANGFIVFLFNLQILKYCGNTALSVYSIISYCVILFNSLFTGVGQAIQPIISINYGAGKESRILSIKKNSYITVILMGIIFSLLGIIFPHLVASAFVAETPEISKIVNYAVRLYFIAFIPMGINVLTSYYLQSIIKSTGSFIVSILRNIVLSGLCIIVLPMFLNSDILWCIMPIVELIVMSISIAFLIRYKKIY